MNTYLVIIKTVLVITQVIRLIQNTVSLSKQTKLIKAQLDELDEVTDRDIKRRVTVDKLLVETLPLILEKYKEENKNE